jgi:hypothetical protein
VQDEGGVTMERVINNLEQYADGLVERLISLKDSNRSNLTRNEIDTINDACNLIYHNRKELKEI